MLFNNESNSGSGLDVDFICWMAHIFMGNEEQSSRGGVGYMTDHHGKPSAMRALSFLAMGASIVFGLLIVWGLVYGGTSPDQAVPGVYIVVVFLLAATAPKAVQKFAEAQFPAPDG